MVDKFPGDDLEVRVEYKIIKPTHYDVTFYIKDSQGTVWDRRNTHRWDGTIYGAHLLELYEREIVSDVLPDNIPAGDCEIRIRGANRDDPKYVVDTGWLADILRIKIPEFYFPDKLAFRVQPGGPGGVVSYPGYVGWLELTSDYKFLVYDKHWDKTREYPTVGTRIFGSSLKCKSDINHWKFFVLVEVTDTKNKSIQIVGEFDWSDLIRKIRGQINFPEDMGRELSPGRLKMKVTAYADAGLTNSVKNGSWTFL